MGIAKTGGTTLTHRLVNAYSEGEVIVGFDQFDKDSLGHVRRLAFERYLRSLAPAEFDKVAIFAGHMPFGIRQCLPCDLSYVGFFRSPVLRSISGFLYGSAAPTSDPEWIKFALHLSASARASPGFDNPLTRILSGSEALVSSTSSEAMLPVTLEDCQLAKRALRRDFLFVGLSEHFETSCMILFDLLQKPYLPGGEKLNVTPVALSIDDVPTPTLRALERGLRHDIDVYNEACTVFNEHARARGLAEAQKYQASTEPHGPVSSGDHCHLAAVDDAFSDAQDGLWLSWPYARKAAGEFIGIEYPERRGCGSIGIQVLNAEKTSFLLEASDDGFRHDVRTLHQVVIDDPEPKYFPVPEHGQEALAWRLKRTGDGRPLQVASLRFDQPPAPRSLPMLRRKVEQLTRAFQPKRPA